MEVHMTKSLSETSRVKVADDVGNLHFYLRSNFEI